MGIKIAFYCRLEVATRHLKRNPNIIHILYIRNVGKRVESNWNTKSNDRVTTMATHIQTTDIRKCSALQHTYIHCYRLLHLVFDSVWATIDNIRTLQMFACGSSRKCSDIYDIWLTCNTRILFEIEWQTVQSKPLLTLHRRHCFVGEKFSFNYSIVTYTHYTLPICI